MNGRNRKTTKRGNTVITPKNKKEQLSNDEIRSRNKQKRIRKKKIRKAILTLGAVSVAVCVCVVLMIAFVFNVGNIAIKGDSKYPISMIVEKSGVAEGDALFLINSDKVKSGIEKSLPYIKNVSVTKKFPDTIIIEVEPAKEMGAVASGGGYIIIDSECKVLSKGASVMNASTSNITGISVKGATEGELIELDSEKTRDALSAVLSAIEKSGIELITEINVKNTKNIKLTYDERITLLVGSVDDIDNKLGRAKHVVKAEDENNVHVTGEVDLRDDKRVIFTADEETTAPPQTEQTSDNGAQTQ